MTAHAPATHRVRYGLDLLARLTELVAEAKAGDPMAPVTVIAPDNISALSIRRRLAHGVAGFPGVAALAVTTLPRLADQLAVGLAVAQSPAPPVVTAAAVREVLGVEPGFFAGVVDNANTIDALADAHRTLRDLAACRDGAELLGRISESSSLAADVVRIHRAVHRRLAGERYDVVDLYLWAADALAEASVAEYGQLIVAAPRQLSNAQIAFMRALGAYAPVQWLVGATGDPRLDAETDELLERCGAPPPEATTSTVVRAAEVIHASDPDEEVRAVVRRIVDDLKSIAGHRIAILYSKRVPYARLCHAQLAAAGVEVNGPGVRPVAERAAARTFFALLGLRAAGYSRPAVMDALSMVRTRDFAGRRIPTVRWDRLSRSAGVIGADDAGRIGDESCGDRGDWARRLDAHLAELALSRRDGEPLSEQRQRTVADTERLRDFVGALQDRLELIDDAADWSTAVEGARGLLHAVIGGPGDADALPGEEQFALTALEQALTQVAQLDAYGEAGGLSGLVELLSAELGSSIPRVGRFGEGVFVGPLSAAGTLGLERVYVVGLTEDLYPGRIGDDALLPDAVRLELDGALPTVRQRIAGSQRDLIVAFSDAEHVVASFARGDLRSTSDRLPSRWLLGTLNELTVRLPPNAARVQATNWARATYREVTAAASFDRALSAAEVLSTAQELRIREAVDGRLSDRRVEAAVELNRARRSSDFTRFDGNLSGQADLPPLTASAGADTGPMVSPTALEQYVDCPHSYFMQRILGVRPLEEPGTGIEIAPIALGNLVHYTLDRFIRDLKNRGELPGPGVPWTETQRDELFGHFDDVVHEFERDGLLGDAALWTSRRMLLEQQFGAYLDADDEWRAEHGVAVHSSELGFGLWDDETGVYSDPVQVPLGDGRVLRMRGSADRVDVGGDGTLYVTDLKTGSIRRFEGIGEADPTVRGSKLQLPIYAYAARVRLGRPDAPAVAQYWFFTADNRRIQLDIDVPTAETYEETLRVIVDNLNAGHFPARAPDDDDFVFVQCRYCNPDGIGYLEARKRWRAKATAPELAGLLTLIDPEGELR